MQKLDPELNHPPESSRDIKGEELLVFLEEEKGNTIVCCNNLHSLNLLASSLKKALVKKNPNAVFYGNNELEKFIADSVVDKYGEAFSDLTGNDGVDNEFRGNAKTILMLENGEKLDENEISILRSLSKKADPEKNKMIVFFNIGISSERVKRKIDTFGNTFVFYDAQDIKIQGDKTDVSLSHNGEIKKPIDQDIEDISTDKRESGVSTGTPKYRSKKFKIIFVLLLAGGFLLSLEEQVQTKILEMIHTSSLRKSSVSLTNHYSKLGFYSATQSKFSVIYFSGNRSTRNSYASR